MNRVNVSFQCISLLLASVVMVSCIGVSSDDADREILIDGSSTVFPISQAVAEEFYRENRAARIMVGASGTGGGFEKFCRGDLDVNNASRHIRQDEIDLCAGNGIDFLELMVASDGLSVIVHPDNDWATCLTIEQLHELWKPGSTISRWSDLNPAWPEQRIHLYGPGIDSGTFDYFTETINGEAGASRADYSASEDDNTLIQGVEGDRYALAYLSYAYYHENRDRLQAVGIDNGAGCVEPSPETIRDNTYAPLARPVFIYVNTSRLTVSGEGESPTQSTVADFVTYYLTEGVEIIPEVGFVPLDDAIYADQLARIHAIGRSHQIRNRVGVITIAAE